MLFIFLLYVLFGVFLYVVLSDPAQNKSPFIARLEDFHTDKQSWPYLVFLAVIMFYPLGIIYGFFKILRVLYFDWIKTS